MCINVSFAMLVTLFIMGIRCSDIVENTANVTDVLNAVDIPDSSLMLFDRLDLRKLAVIKYHARKQEDDEDDDDDEEDEDDGGNTNTTSTIPSRPCSCDLGVCKCCTGYVLDLFKQKACMKIAYHPGDFAFDVAMSMNDRVLYENSLSGKNPKPICISPPRLSNLKVCAKFYNVFFPGRNFHFCLAMVGQWRQLEMFNLSFDCLRMGANGIAMMKPEDSGGITIPNPQGGVDAVIDAGEDDIEDYDENLVKSLFNVFD